MCSQTKNMRAKSLAPAVAVLVVPGLLVLLAGGCCQPTCSATPPELADIDFARLKLATELADDITLFNDGYKTENDLRQTWERAGVTLEFDQVAESPYTYMLFTDDTHGFQAVVLSGTTRPEEWILDFQVELVEDEELGIRLHSGWRDGARAIAADVLPKLKDGYDLYIFGYSLGAGTGTILGLYFQEVLDVQVAGVFASGMPRITDAEGTAAFATLPLIRTVAGNDNIPFLPATPYVSFGDVLVLLDGPFVSRQRPGDPDYDNRPTTQEDVLNLNPEDHLTYVQRVQDKDDGPVCLVPYADRLDYVD